MTTMMKGHPSSPRRLAAVNNASPSGSRGCCHIYSLVSLFAFSIMLKMCGKPKELPSTATNKPPMMINSNKWTWPAASLGRGSSKIQTVDIPRVEEDETDEEANKDKDEQEQERERTKRHYLMRQGGYRSHELRPSLHLLGERHTGTTWMGSHLKECFGSDVDVVRGYSDWKHWFQSQDENDRGRLTESAVVVALFRNVFEWSEAMRSNPHHAPMHHNLPWREFVTKPWTMPRYNEDLQFDKYNLNETTAPENVKCRWASRQKRPHEIIPCLANQTFVVDYSNSVDLNHSSDRRRVVLAYYEMRNDGSGKPYDNILELRAAKIYNFKSVEHFSNVKTFYAIHYEDMARNGTHSLIGNLERDLNVTAKCQGVAGKMRRSRPLSKEFVQYLKDNVDWDAEALIGFGPNDTGW